MRQIIFATGNRNKFYEASSIAKKFEIEILQQDVDGDEIQHHDPLEITRAKVRAAYYQVNSPVVVNDSSWDIPVLGGFPGGYMKDVSAWLRAADFKALMEHRDDRRIYLTDTVAFYDGEELEVFSHRRVGRFLLDLDVDPHASFDSLVQMDGEPTTIAEILAQGDWDVNAEDRYRHWYEFARWCAAQ